LRRYDVEGVEDPCDWESKLRGRNGEGMVLLLASENGGRSGVGTVLEGDCGGVCGGARGEMTCAGPNADALCSDGDWYKGVKLIFGHVKRALTEIEAL
jgi:hypothetical protein